MAAFDCDLRPCRNQHLPVGWISAVGQTFAFGLLAMPLVRVEGLGLILSIMSEPFLSPTM